MNDPTSYNFSFSYNQPPQAASKPIEPDLLMFDECREYQLPDNHVLIRSKRTGKQSVVTNDVLYALRFCSVFRTLDDHLSYVANNIPELAGDPSDLRGVIQALLAAGLFASARSYSEQLNREATAAVKTAETAVVIITCDRPDAVERLLESVVANSSFTPDRSYYLVDDSREPLNIERNEAIVEKANNLPGISLRYFGPVQQRAFREQLIARLPGQQEEIDFLIGRQSNSGLVSHGRSRNMALLLSVGKRAILMDDDIVCRALEAPFRKKGIEISSLPKEADFYDSGSGWQQLPEFGEKDPVSLHTRFLGATLGEAINRVEDNAFGLHSVKELLPHELTAVNSNSPVLITACGTLGDPGTSSINWIYELASDSRSRLLETEEKYQQSKTLRNTWLGKSRYCFTTHFALLSQMTGLDNRALLPPYFPVLRNEDFLFGEMVQFLYPDSVLMDLPWAVPHLPLEERSWQQDSLAKPMHCGFLDFTADQISKARSNYHSPDPNTRVDALALYFKDLAETDDSALSELARSHNADLITAGIQRLDNALKENGNEPESWAGDVGTLIRTNQQAIGIPATKIFADIPSDPAHVEEIAQVRGFWRSFGSSIAAWKGIRSAAADIIG